MTYLILAAVTVCLLGLFGFIKSNIKKRPKQTIIISMVFLIFAITLATIVKTYTDYTLYISSAQGVIVSNVAFALFLDFSVLIIGGLFLYLANEIYLADKLLEEKIAQAKKKLKEKQEKETLPPSSD